MIKIDLNGRWKMKAAGEETYINAIVPGSVASDFLRAGRIEDPYYRENHYDTFDLFRQDYEYERQFHIAEDLLKADCLELICEGLDTLSEIQINNKVIAQTANMHRTYHLDVKSYLREGLNTLNIVFRSPVKYVEEKQKESYLWGANEGYAVNGFPHLRKAHHMFGWDWGPMLPDSGIWRNIYLKAFSKGRITDVYTLQTHNESGSVTLNSNVSVESFGGMPLEIEASLEAPGGAVFTTARVSIVDGKQLLTLTVNKPELWWPNGLGAQPLYNLKLQLTSEGQIIDERSYSIGLRTLTVRREPDAWGESFEFVVNRVAIFTMGANYIPEDNLRDRLSKERTERLIRDCVDANFNCIRVWGGGFYPDDYFFDLCDQYGLIVWQDHMFACAEYEMNALFTEEIKNEVADNVKRIRHHASLGLWCGNNEMEVAWVEWDFPKRAKLRTDYIKQFEIILPEVTQLHDPVTFYWVASPSSGGGFDEPNADHRGDVHYWEVWHGGKPFTEYRKHYFRFCSEFGFQSFPSLKTVTAFTEKDDHNIFTPIMESHQKNKGGNGKILHAISENFLYPQDFDSLLYVSQLLQAEAMRYGVEHWRRNRGRCMGSIYWQLNDCWPVASWSSIDYYGRWKALHYSAKRFYAPFLISAEEEGTHVGLSVTNDTMQAVSGKVVWQLRDQGKKIIQSGLIEVRIDALSAKECANLDFAYALQDSRLLRDHYLEYGFVVNDETVSGGAVLFVKPKHFRLLPAELQAEIREESDCYVIEVRTSAFAMFVELDFKGRDARFSDNFFHLSAGAPKRVVLKKEDLSQPAALEELKRELTLRSLVDTYN